MAQRLKPVWLLIPLLVAGGCASQSKPGAQAKGPVRKVVELPVAATEKGLDKSYSVIEKRIKLPGGNKAPRLERELPIYEQGGSNISGLQHD